MTWVNPQLSYLSHDLTAREIALFTLYKVVTEYANYRVTAFLASSSSYLLNAIYTTDVNIIFWLKRTHLTQRFAVRWWRTVQGSFLVFVIASRRLRYSLVCRINPNPVCRYMADGFLAFEVSSITPPPPTFCTTRWRHQHVSIAAAKEKTDGVGVGS